MKKLALALSTALLSAGAAHAQSATYVVEPTHTFVTFEAKHFGVSTNRGRFDKKEGTITIDPTAKTGKVEITIDMASINTGTAAFDAHLRRADFFDAEKFATAKFVGDKFEFDGSKIKSVAGSLTMLGKTMPVTLNAELYGCYDHPRLKVQVCGGDFVTTIQRSQWGMGWGINFGIPDTVRLEIQVEAIKQP
jgi:polyisoprenoid-binding protein YceI